MNGQLASARTITCVVATSLHGGGNQTIHERRIDERTIDTHEQELIRAQAIGHDDNLAERVRLTAMHDCDIGWSMFCKLVVSGGVAKQNNDSVQVLRLGSPPGHPMQ
jgi:hypothetical protein